MLRDIKSMQRETKCEVAEQAFKNVSWQIYIYENGSENYYYYNILKRLS